MSLDLFIPITKIDEEKRLVYGTITEELIDKSGEVFDYDSSKPYYEKWSSEISKATDGKSLGNVRAMHRPKAAGKLVALLLDDSAKRISCVAKVVDDAEWKLCLEGVYTGFSQGGRYVRRWVEDGVKRFTADPAEVSLVDNPNLATAHFQLAKADGSVEVREFKRAAIGQGKEAQMNLKKFGGPENGTEEDVEKLIKAATDKSIEDVSKDLTSLRKQLAEMKNTAGEALTLQAKVEELEKAAKDREEKDLKVQMKKVLDGGIAAGKIKAAKREEWEKNFRDLGAVRCEAILKDMAAVVPMGQRVGAGGADDETIDEQCDKIVNKIMADEKVGYDEAYAKGYSRNSRLFKQRDAAQLALAGTGGGELGGASDE